MEGLKSIQKLWRDHAITAEQFLNGANIGSQIRSHLEKFINYCRTHKRFTEEMIRLAFDVSYQQLEDPFKRKASYTAHQVFGNEESEVFELFFQPPAKPEEDPNEIKQEVEGIQSQAERLFSFDDDEEETTAPEEQREVEVTREELVNLSLEILRHPEKNETCLGHLQKMYSFFIRHQPIPVLAYFSSHPQMLQLLLKNLAFSSVSSLLSQLLTSEDKNKQYKYQPLKKSILSKVIEEMFLNMRDKVYFDGVIVFLEEILNATKQSYFEYFQDFKRISNYLVSAPVLGRFYEELFKLEEASLCNTSRFLEILFNRINSQGEDSRYYDKQQQNQPTMTFQIDSFTENIPKLFELARQIQSFKSMTKINYYSFVEALLSTGKVKEKEVSLVDPSFMALFDVYKEQKTGGICKNKIYHIIKLILMRSSEGQLKQFIEKHPQVYEQYFTVIKSANYSNTKYYNKNECSGFDISLIAQITRKEESLLLTASKVVGKDLKRICRKYDTKIASFQNSASFSLEEECNFYQYNAESGRNSEGSNGFNLTVGKNNISIPTLHLPDRYQNTQGKESESSPEVNKNPQSPDLSPTELSGSPQKSSDTGIEPKEIVEEEEVVVLTNKIGGEKVINLADVIAEKMEAKTREEKMTKSVPTSSPVVSESPKQQEKQKLIEVPSIQSPHKQQKQLKQPKQPKVVDSESEKARFFARHLALYT